MPTAHAPPRKALWGLWAMFTAAVMGFAIFLAGLFGPSETALLAGVGLMVFSMLVYLFLHFWNTAHAAFQAPAEGPTPAKRPPVRARLATRAPPPAADPPATMEPLVERTRTYTPTAVADASAPGWDYPPSPTAAGRSVEQNLVAAPAGGSAAVALTGDEGALGRMLTEPVPGDRFVHATKRRHEIVRGLPLVGRVFDEEPKEAPAEHPAKPGMTRGRCSGCNSVLWAPAVRPVRLRCPRCNKTKWLDA